MNVLDWHQQAFDRILADKARLPHALLFRGQRGIGKLVFARTLAQALLCETPAVSGAACGTCTACIWFDAGTHPDYRQIEPMTLDDGSDGERADKKVSPISVDQIRALPDFINISSHRGGVKVIVINPAELLNVNAANALLKNLEEPPPRTHFLLVTHRPHQLLATIKSRCQQIELPRPSSPAAAAWLARHGLRDPQVALAQTDNSPLLALELNETDYWGARSAFLRQLSPPGFDVMAAAEASWDMRIAHVLEWLQKWSYDIAYWRNRQRVRYNPDHAQAIERLATKLDPLATLRFHREMIKLQISAQHPLNARLFIEQLLLSYADLLQKVRIAA